MKIIDCAQGSPEWLEARCGVVTCSELKHILAKGDGKTRTTYMEKKAGEVITKRPMKACKNDDMERGNEQEAIAREFYEIERQYIVEPIGFVIDEDLRLGYSPDGFVGNDGLAEYKSRDVHVQIGILKRGKVPTENYAQLQGGLLVTGRAWIDYFSYCDAENMPNFLERVYPDADYQARIVAELKTFYEELDALVKKIRGFA
jgi:hypothetical protein